MSASECLVLMPMLAGYEGIREVVARSVGAAGAEMRRLENVLSEPDWQHWLIDAVSTADCVLVDLTDHNPFVMYELGLAHGQHLPVLFFVNRRNRRVPGTVLGSPFLEYDDASLADFEPILATGLKDMLRQLDQNQIELTLSRSRISGLYDRGTSLFESFTADTGAELQAVAAAEFHTRLAVAWARGDIVPSEGTSAERRYLLARIVQESDLCDVMSALHRWSASASSRDAEAG